MFIKQTDTTRMKPEMVVEKTKLNGYQILDRLRSHWLSTLAHDLSNPLFVARGYTRLALEENEKIMLRFSAARGPEASREASPPDVSMPCKLWRLHGGATSVGLAPDSEYLVACELPVIRLFEC